MIISVTSSPLQPHSVKHLSVSLSYLGICQWDFSTCFSAFLNLITSYLPLCTLPLPTHSPPIRGWWLLSTLHRQLDRPCRVHTPLYATGLITEAQPIKRISNSIVFIQLIKHTRKSGWIAQFSSIFTVCCFLVYRTHLGLLTEQYEAG